MKTTKHPHDDDHRHHGHHRSPRTGLIPSGSITSILPPLCLLGLGLTLGWLTALALLTATALIRLGYQLAKDHLHGDGDRAWITAQRQALDAEWRALDHTRRVRAVLLEARRAMQAEARADNDGWRPPADSDQES